MKTETLIHASDLHAQRLDAALASKGTSDEAIYETVLQLCAAYEIRGNLLEFGAGTGNLARRLFSKSYNGNITAIDILPRPDSLPSAVTWVRADLNEPLPLPAASVDAIVSSEVIEHLENPRSVFREFNRVLRDGGTIVVSTPNQESIRSLVSLIFRGHFVSFLDSCYPAHITALLKTDFKRICTETGFCAPTFYYTNRGGLPKLPWISWQDLTGGVLKGSLFSDNLALVTRKTKPLIR